MSGKTVNQASTMGLITIHHSKGMDQAFDLLKKNRIRHLPVVSDAGEIIGILSDRDVQRAMRSRIESRGEVGTAESVDFDPAAVVRDYMSWPVHTTDRGASLSYATEKMIREKISALLVMDGSRVVGILTSEDLLKVLLQLLNTPGGAEKLDVESVIQDPRWNASSFSPY